MAEGLKVERSKVGRLESWEGWKVEEGEGFRRNLADIMQGKILIEIDHSLFIIEVKEPSRARKLLKQKIVNYI